MSALLVVILVAIGEARHPTTIGAARAAREVIGPEAAIEVREMDVVPNDDGALALGASLHAAGIVELSWDIPAHRRAQLRFHLDRRPGFTDRTIVFDEADDVAERGRTIGYAIASMMTVPVADPARAPPPPASPESSVPPVRPVVHPEATPKTPPRGAIDVVAAGAAGIDGPAGGWGGSVSGRWYFSAPFAVRLGISVRAGQVALAQATSLHMHAAGGLAWVPFRAARSPGFELGVRVDALLMREQLTHLSSDDPEPVPAMRWLPGAEAALEGGWFFSPNAGFLGCFATEVAFGRTDVTLHRQLVTSVPPLRLVFQAGVRATF